MSKNPTIDIPPLVYAYLEDLADLGVYGDTPGRVASFILRKEIMRLIESNRLNPISKKRVAPAAPKSQEAAKPPETAEGDGEEP